MRRFRLILFVTSGLAQGPFVVLVAFVLRAFSNAWVSWTVAVLLGAVALWLLRGRVAVVFDDRPVSAPRRLLERVYYTHWGASIAALPLSFVLVPIGLVAGTGIASGAIAAYALSLGVAMYAVFVRPVWVRVRELEVEVTGLPDAFDGYRIAHLSDLHVGSLCPPERARRWVRTTNALAVDAVALTGDYVTSGTRFHEVTAHVLGELRATDGVFAVLGNHDDYGKGEPLRTEMRSVGIKLLLNERTTVERAGSRLTIAGVDDTYTRRADVDVTMADLGSSEVVIALAHDPSLFPKLADRGAALVLSGHTHWGQVALPFFEERVNLAARFYRYHAGIYRREASVLYIHPGLGTTGPPLRFGVAPEITVLKLRALRAATR